VNQSVSIQELSVTPASKLTSITTEDKKVESTIIPSLPVASSKVLDIDEVACTDKVWCAVPMPQRSHFKFDPPTDKVKWRIAQSQAASGEQVLLRRVTKVFPHPFDFLDGDKSFRKLHSTVDIFIDSKEDFKALLPGGIPGGFYSRRLESSNNDQENIVDEHLVEVEYSQKLEEQLSRRRLVNKVLEGAKKGQAQSVDKNQVVPQPYHYKIAKRSPIVQIGYMAFKRAGAYFAGDFQGGVFMKREDFFSEWAVLKDKIDTSFVTMCALNENWGFLSTMFPNRTAGWGKCCEKTNFAHKDLYDFLDHKKTLMLVVGQHSNISHPKILTIPRGVPLTW
jgi:hypothetical protein